MDDYSKHHQNRISLSLNYLENIVKKGDTIFNVGVSSIDSTLWQLAEKKNLKIYSIVPNKQFIKAFNFQTPENIIYFDVTNPESPLPAQQCDFMIMMEVLEHLFQDDNITMKNISRIMKPSALLFLTVPNATEFFTRVRFLLGHNVFWSKKDILNGVYGGYGHIREYTLDEVITILEDTGFKIIDKLAINGYRYSITKILNFLPISFGNTIAILVKKK